MIQHKFELQTFLQWNTASRIHPDDLKSLACLYCVMCDIISYELSAPQKYSSTHFSAVRAGQRPGRCVRRWNLISHYTQHKRNIKTIFCPGWAVLGWAGQTGWELWNGACVWMIQCLDSGMWVSHMEQPVNITIPCWWNHILLIQINQLESVSVQMVLIQPCFNLWF